MHLNPEEEELWTEDLAWVQALIAHRHKEKEDGEEVSLLCENYSLSVALLGDAEPYQVEREEWEEGVLVKKRVTAEELLLSQKPPIATSSTTEEPSKSSS